MKNYYPRLLTGELKWTEQQRYFRCLHDTLQLFVEKNLFTHDPSRDHYTKEEIFRLFNWYFKIEEHSARLLTDKVFVIKKILIGGSINQLKDKEIETFYKLIYDYRDIYFEIQSQIPVFWRLFNSSASVTKEEYNSTQLEKAFKLLKQAYINKNVVYPLEDLNRYGEYLVKAKLVAKSKKQLLDKSVSLLQHLFQGFLYPKTQIKGNDWEPTLNSLQSTLKLLFYYKVYFAGSKMSLPEQTYRLLTAGELLIDSLNLPYLKQNQKDFPLKHLEGVLQQVFFFINSQSSAGLKNSVLKNIYKNNSLPLLIRAIDCFMLEDINTRECHSVWPNSPEASQSTASDLAKVDVPVLVFPDSQFKFYPDRIEPEIISSPVVFIKLKKLNFLKQWIKNYKEDLWQIHEGHGASLASHRRFSQWLDPFFGWDTKRGIVFGAFKPPASNENLYQLLNYQAFLPLLLSSYFPEFSLSEFKKGSSISKEVWGQIVQDLSPLLATFGLGAGYNMGWRDNFLSLFTLADSFLYSSNRDEQLQSRELIDLTVHLMEALKAVEWAQNTTFKNSHSLKVHQVVTALLEGDLLASFPRFIKQTSGFFKNKYQDKLISALGEPEQLIEPIDLLPLFILIQTAEINYHLIDNNQSFNLESQELSLFAKEFEEVLFMQIPYIYNQEQAHSYIMYSFKTGDMPFFTGSAASPLDFTNWHINPLRRQEEFKVTAPSFHFLMLDFYKLYMGFSQ